MYANLTMGELLVSAELAGVIIWVLNWPSGERSQSKENVRAKTLNQILMATFLGEEITRQSDRVAELDTHPFDIAGINGEQDHELET